MKTKLLFRQPIALVCLAVALSSIPSDLNAQEKSRPSAPRPAVTSPAPASPGGTPEQEAFRKPYGIPREGVPPGTNASPYALEIMDGQLSLANLKGIVNVRKHWGPGDIHSVPATLGNVIDVLRDMHTDANIAMSPQLGRIQIADLKLRATSLEEELEALRVASGNRFVWMKAGMFGGGVDPTTGLPIPPPPPAGSPSLYSLTADEVGGQAATKRSVEVFNLAAYLQHEKDGGKWKSEAQASIKEIEEIILNTLVRLKQDNWSPDEEPSYQFHSGANLLIVIGRQDALEVARKVVSALQAEAGSGAGGRGFGGFGLPQPLLPTPLIQIPTRPARVPDRKLKPDDLEARLRAAQVELAERRTTLTDKHPRIQALLVEIEALKRRISEGQGTPGAPLPSSQPGQAPPPAKPKP